MFSNKSRRCKPLADETLNVIRLGDLPRAAVADLLNRYGLTLVIEDSGATITGSFWGDSEAGIVGHTVYARTDTPVHSLLHESCHAICMSRERREALHGDAGGDDLEEAAVCYLQILLADCIESVGRDRLMADMDSWGYSFRRGSTAAWFETDAEDALNWLIDKGVVNSAGSPTFVLRR